MSPPPHSGLTRSRPRIDFVPASDNLAVGVSRLQRPLLTQLQSDESYDVRPVHFSVPSPKLLFPYLYGPLPLRLTLRRASLTHLTNGWYGHMVPALPHPAIVTCHDLIDLEDLRRRTRAFKPHRRFHIEAAFAGMLRARMIVCVSQATARIVESYAPQISDRLRVVHSGLAPIFRESDGQEERVKRLGLRDPYVLYVGSEQPRKNLERLVCAVAAARQHHPQLGLVKVGGHQTTEGRAALLTSLRREGLLNATTFLETVGDEDLAAIYRSAAVTILASLQEGFGFPALEAMACGSPVIVSDRGALPEITGGAALVVDALDVRGLARAIERVLENRDLQLDLANRGRARAAEFTWERAARAYLAVYDEVLRQP